MMKLHFAAAPKVAAAADHLLVIAPAACFGPRSGLATVLRRHLGADDVALVMRLGAEATPGLLGGTATSLRKNGKQRLTVAALADKTSRHASPARAEAIRRVVNSAGLAGSGDRGVLLVLEHADHVLPAISHVARALPTFSRKSKAKAEGTLHVACLHQKGGPLAPDAAAITLVTRAREAAAFVDTPPTELDPATFAAAAKRLLRGQRAVKVTELVGDTLRQKGLGGLHAVGRCARSAPRLVIATLPGKGKGPHVALVGKGITYDTGGLHLKARGQMETMKSDMGGAAAVLGAFLALAGDPPRGRLSLLLCLAENAIGPDAYKPDDILTLHSGKTVEIDNTDAEGRLVLADGCSYAARVLGADIVLDAATLTGAQGVATGDLHAAVIANDAAVEQALVEAGRATGDLCWPLPFAPEFYRSEFASPVADMRNSVKNRSNAQVSCAAEFIHWHLDGTKVLWGHVDLAYPAFRSDRGTGFGVLLLAAAVRQLVASAS
ncbi:MAG: leucyl aminopeptidase family protein [Planctomycetes bacterium]|nr:leucyl aminopeptidase family protein [Planctomycetota bacterium]